MLDYGFKITYKATEPLEGPRYSEVWVYFNQNILGSVNVDLQHSSTVQRAVKEHHEALMGYVWSSGSHVTPMLDQHVSMVFTVEQFKLFPHLMNDTIKNEISGFCMAFVAVTDTTTPLYCTSMNY